MAENDSDIDTSTLDSYLTAELDIVVDETEVLHDGLNLILAISAAEDGKAYILRRPNKLRHTDYLNDLRQEYWVMQRLEDTAIPTPDPVVFCDDASVLGNQFFVMTYLDGAAIPLGSDLPAQYQNAKSRGKVADCLLDTLTEIHSVDVEPFKDVCKQQTPGDQVARATDRLDRTTRVTGHELPTLWAVAEWLQQNAPSDPKTTLIHGDFRPGNVLFAGTDQPEITGVLDWETAMLGDPLTELGYLLLRWRDDNDPTPSLDGIEARYPNEDAIQQLREINENGLAPFTNQPGSPSQRELVTRYEEQTGISFENERFYRAFAAFSLATVWEDLHHYQIEAGVESDWEPHIEYMSMIADSIVNGEFQL